MNFNLIFFILISIKNILSFKHSLINNYNFIKFECSKWDGKCIDTLIFKGGGSRAIAYAGAIKKFEEEDMIKKFKYLAGTSSGAQTAALLCCGYTSRELENALRYAPWDRILDVGFLNIDGIINLITKYGYFDSNNLREYIEFLIFNKTGIKDITFLELFEYSNIHLKIGVCSLTDKKFKYIDHLSYPDMPISVGLAASSSIPFIFSSTEWKNELFVDGGLIGNLPVTAFPENKCLAFNLLDITDKNNIDDNPKNVLDFGRIVIKILYQYAQEMFRIKNKNLKNIEYIEIYTNKISLLDLKIKDESIKKLINFGYNAVETFLKC